MELRFQPIFEKQNMNGRIEELWANIPTKEKYWKEPQLAYLTQSMCFLAAVELSVPNWIHPLPPPPPASPPLPPFSSSPRYPVCLYPHFQKVKTLPQQCQYTSHPSFKTHCTDFHWYRQLQRAKVCGCVSVPTILWDLRDHFITDIDLKIELVLSMGLP